MKNILFGFFLSLICISASAQYPLEQYKGEWVQSLNKWRYTERKIFTYNANDQIDSVLTYAVLYFGGNWEVTSNDKYHYDNNNKLIRILSSSIDYWNQSWYLFGLKKFEYDTLNRLIKISHFRGSDTSSLDQDDVYVYNNSNNLSAITTTQYWGHSNPVTDIDSFTYDGQGRIIQHRHYHPLTTVRPLYYTIDYQYTSFDSIQSSSKFKKHANSPGTTETREYFYNTNHYVDYILINHSIWLPSKLEYHYTPNNEISQIKTLRKNSLGGPWVNYQILENTSVLLNVDKENIQSDFKVFPNPTKDILHLHSNYDMTNSKLLITDVHGKMVLSHVLKDNQGQIKVSSLIPGIYFFELHQSDQIQKGKFIKE